MLKSKESKYRYAEIIQISMHSSFKDGIQLLEG